MQSHIYDTGKITETLNRNKYPNWKTESEPNQIMKPTLNSKSQLLQLQMHNLSLTSEIGLLCQIMNRWKVISLLLIWMMNKIIHNFFNCDQMTTLNEKSVTSQRELVRHYSYTERIHNYFRATYKDYLSLPICFIIHLSLYSSLYRLSPLYLLLSIHLSINSYHYFLFLNLCHSLFYS